MVLNFKKNIVVGVSVNPERGLEVAQIDFDTKTVLKYGSRPLAYDNARREIVDLDIFKETLQDLLLELQIKQGSEIVLNIPAVVFNVADYPASLNEEQVSTAIEEDLVNHPIFQNTETCVAAAALPNSTIQFNKVAYTVAQRVMLTEIAIQIKELGYKLIGIDTSVNSTLNALIYNDRVDTAPNVSWVLLLVENNCCRILSMQGRNYVDSFEERISIGEVLGDAENYATVVQAITPVLKNLPAQQLYVVSKTNIISAKILADKITYNAQIIHQEANNFASTPYLQVSDDVSEDSAALISLDVIGAAINRDFKDQSNAHLNLFNASLGDIYTLSQPPVIKFGSLSFALSTENMIIASIVVAVIVLIISILTLVPLNSMITTNNSQIKELDKKITAIEKFLKDNESVSAEMFNEGDEIRMGLVHNKNIYTYYTVVGTEIPKKLWLTKLNLGKNVTIEGQADNLESVYSFFRNIKDYNQGSKVKLQKLGLATSSNMITLSEEEAFDTDSIITTMNADFYEFRISDAPEKANKKDTKDSKKNNKGLPAGLEPLD